MLQGMDGGDTPGRQQTTTSSQDGLDLPRLVTPFEAPQSAMPPGWPYSFNVVARPCGISCNLGCVYCHSTAQGAAGAEGGVRMSDALLEAYIRQYIDAQRVPEATFVWWGGEPTLLGLPFFEQVVQLQQKHRRPGMEIHNVFHTNGMLLDDAWCRFLAHHGFLVGLSADGPRRQHDTFRLDRTGQPTFLRASRACTLLAKHCVAYSINCRVHAGNAGHGREVYRFLRDELRATAIQFLPVIEHVYEDGVFTDALTTRSITPEAFGAFLIDVFDEWVMHDVGYVHVQMFDMALAVWSGEQAGSCTFEETCGLNMALDHNGDLFSCSRFADAKHLLGNIHTTPMRALVSSERQWQHGESKRETLPQQCRECSVRFVCNGGCPSDRFIQTETGEPGLNYLCKGYHAFFTHIDRPMRMMVEEINAGRQPANVTYRLRAERIAGRPLNLNSRT